MLEFAEQVAGGGRPQQLAVGIDEGAVGGDGPRGRSLSGLRLEEDQEPGEDAHDQQRNRGGRGRERAI